MRYPHYIKPATQARFPSRILCVACDGEWLEGNEERRWDFEDLTGWACNTLRRDGTSYYLSSTRVGKSADDWWKWLAEWTDDTHYTWIISHNCRRVWSLLGLWEQLEHGAVTVIDKDHRSPKSASSAVRDVRQSMRGKLAGCSAGSMRRLQDKRSGLLVLQSPPCIARLRCKDKAGSVTWVDTRNYGVECSTESGASVQAVAWLQTFVTQFAEALNAYKLGGMKCTAGSQAMHGWRYGYYKGGVYCHGHKQALETERQAYYGGRCECYRIGAIDRPIWHVDIRSSYAACCHSERVPARLRRVLSPGIQAERLARQEPERCIARVTIETDEAAYPYRRDTDIIYPIGRFTTTLCGPELQDAIRDNRVRTVLCVNYYDCYYSLRDYANAVYAMRARAEHEGSIEIATIAKRLLVSLPGKFGQTECRWINCDGVPADIPYGEWYGTDAAGLVCRFRSVGWIVQREERTGWSYDACPAIAGWITSAGRMALLRLIMIAGWQHVYYCDTDSLMVDEVGYGRLRAGIGRHDKQLGRAYVKSGPSQVSISGTKFYSEGTSLVCSGMPGRDCQDAGDGIHYWYSDTPATAIRRRQRPESTRYLGRYQRGSEYTARLVADDGATKPIEIWE